MAITRKPDYADLDLDFIAHPTTGDIVRKIGPDAIKRSVRNLILTNFYDRPFRPGIGSNVQKLLFENPSPLTLTFLKDAIAEVLRNYEPRIAVNSIDVQLDFDQNGFNVRLEYVILNTLLPVVSTLFLERIR